MPTHTATSSPRPRGAGRSCARLALGALAAALLAAAPPARGEPVRLVPGAGERIDLAPAMTRLHDPTGAWSAADVRSEPLRGRFVPVGRDEGLGYVRGAVWVRVELENPSDAPGAWLVTFDFPLLEAIDAYVAVGGAAAEHRRGGIRVPPSGRTIAHRGAFHELPLALDAGERAELLVRLETRGSMILSASVQDRRTLAARQLPRLAFHGLNLGVLLALAILNLYSFLALRDRSHLHSALLLGAFGGYAASVSGSAAALSPLWTPRWTMIAPTVFAVSACWLGVRFGRRFLGIPRLLPRLDAWRHVSWAALPVGLLTLVDLRAANTLGALLGVVTVLVLAVWAARSWRAGYRHARFFAAAMAGFTLPALAFAATVLGVVPPRVIAVLALELGFSFAGVVFAFALADRLRAADRRAKETLEDAVRDRTRQLEQTVEALRREVDERRRAEAARRDTEEKLRRSQRIEAVGRLAGGVAHDYNNLLTSISTNVGFLLLDLPPDDPRRGVLEEMSEAVDRSASLTRQLLALGRRQPVEPRPLSVNEVVENLRRLLARLLGEGIDLRLALAPGAGLVLADHGQVEQVVINLVLNARDALPCGGRITLTTREVEIARGAEPQPDAQPGRYLALEVADSGTGIAPEVQRHLFEPFFTTKAEGKGSGLGLATVHGIVQAHGGFVEVDPNPGRGAAFRVHFPLATPAAPACAVPPLVPHALAGGTERILLAEDEHVVREGTQRLLERLGYHVVAARDGAEALRVADQSGPFDLLLSDVVLGDLSGHGLALRLQSRWPGLRVLLASGHAQDVIGEAGVTTGDVHFVAKPYTPAALAAKVRAALDAPAPAERRRGVG